MGIDPALHCTPFSAPDLADQVQNVTALASNKIQAAALQERPMALIPQQDPTIRVDGGRSLEKLDLYREGGGHRLASNVSARNATGF